MCYKLLRTSLISTPFPRLNYWKTTPFTEGRIYLSLLPPCKDPAPFESPHFLLNFGVSTWRFREQKHSRARRKRLYCRLSKERKYQLPLAIFDVREVNVLVFNKDLRNYDGDGKENVRKAVGLMSKTTTLHLHHAFLFISLLSLHNYTTWNDQILILLENGNGEAINSSISVWTRAPFPLFSSNHNSLLLSNRANWDNREKV